MNRPLSAQRVRERAVFLYSNALERGDFELVSKILQQAERDPMLERMIADLDAGAEVTEEQPEAGTRIVHKSDGIERIITVRRPSFDGQTPKSDQSKEDFNMVSTIQEFEQVQPRLRPSGMRWLTLLAAVLVVVLMAILAVIVFRAGFVGNPILLQSQPTPTPTVTPRPPVITRDNVDQLELQKVFGYGTVNTLSWVADSNKLLFTTSSGVIGYLNPQNLGEPPTFYQRKYVEGEDLSNWQQFFTPVLSRDGKLLLLMMTDGLPTGVYTVWDTTSGKQITKLDTLSLFSTMVFSSDVAGVIAGNDMGRIFLWNARTGQELRHWKGAESRIFALAFSPDDKLLVTGGADQLVKLWDVASGDLLGSLNGHKGLVTTVTFSPDGNMVASGGRDGMVWLWNWRQAAGTAHVTLQREGKPILWVEFSPDGKYLAAIGEDNLIHLWDVVNGAALGTLKGHNDTVKAIAFSPDGTQLVSSSSDGTVRLWDVATLAEAQNVILMRGQDQGVLGEAAFSPDGKTVAAGGVDGVVQLWDVTTGEVQRVLHQHANSVNSVAYSPDGKTVASAGADSTIGVWDAETGTQRAVLSGADVVVSVVFSPDGSLLASGGADNVIHIWDTKSYTERAALTGHTDTIVSLAFSPDGTRLASASFDGRARLWDVATDASGRILDTESGQIGGVTFSPDGKMLATSGSDNKIRLWDVESGTLLKMLEGHEEGGVAFSLAFSPDGSLLVSGGGAFYVRGVATDTTLRLWDVATGKQLMVLLGHTQAIGGVRFSPDGSKIVSASDDGTIRLWALPAAGG